MLKVEMIYEGRKRIINAATVEVTDKPFEIYINDVSGSEEWAYGREETLQDVYVDNELIYRSEKHKAWLKSRK